MLITELNSNESIKKEMQLSADINKCINQWQETGVASLKSKNLEVLKNIFAESFCLVISYFKFFEFSAQNKEYYFILIIFIFP